MKKSWLGILLLLLVAAGISLVLHLRIPMRAGGVFSPADSATLPQAGSPTNNPGLAVSVDTASAGSNALKANPPEIQPASLAARAGRVPDSSPAPELPPEIVLRNVRAAIRQYGEMFGGNPVGTNPEITRQLRGSNSKHVNFINPEAGLRANQDGELIDAWNTPYFFHQLSGADMEIRSAGPDRIMWTSDDLVVK